MPNLQIKLLIIGTCVCIYMYLSSSRLGDLSIHGGSLNKSPNKGEMHLFVERIDSDVQVSGVPQHHSVRHFMHAIWWPKLCRDSRLESHIPQPSAFNPPGRSLGTFSTVLNLCSFGKWCLNPSLLKSPPHYELGNKFICLGHVNKNETLFCEVSV